MQVLEVDVPLIDIKVWACSYLVFMSESITTACVKYRVWPKRLRTWVGVVAEHGYVGLGYDVAYWSFCDTMRMFITSRGCLDTVAQRVTEFSKFCQLISCFHIYLYFTINDWASSQDVHRRVLTYWLLTLILIWTSWTQGILDEMQGLWTSEHIYPLWPTLWWVNASTTNCCPGSWGLSVIT